jgi:hypothetical protein
MKTNLVIATFNGKNKRKHLYPEPKDILRYNLLQFKKYSHNLAQITIMNAKSDNYYNDYYNINDISATLTPVIKIIPVKNYGFSMGQWLKAFEHYRNEFDFYIFIEDDYCIGMDNIDKILIEQYKSKFPNNIGMLCSLKQGIDDYYKYMNINKYPVHFEGCVICSSQTLEHLYNCDKWNSKPRKWLDLIETIDSTYPWDNLKRSYIGAYYQVVFSHLFTLSDIEINDYINENGDELKLSFGYWSDTNDFPLGGYIEFYNKNNTIKEKYTIADIYNSPIIPIQLCNEEFIIKNCSDKLKPILIFIIGMHRTGSSLLSNCLISNGFSIGKSVNKDKDWQNPNGYFENDKFTDIHDQLLKYNNSAWNKISTMQMLFNDQHIQEYQELLRNEFDNNIMILIKDPRLTFFVDFLRRVCVDYDYYFIFLTRNKVECCTSLSTAQHKNYKEAENLYDITHEFYNKDQMIKIKHRDILYQNDKTMKRIAEYCNFAIRNKTNNVVDFNLYRNRK